MKYIVGLGNPGESYRNTRHNIGWRVLDAVCATWQLPAVVPSRAYSGWYTEGVIKDVPVAVLYPDTFMNHSGRAVQKLVPSAELDQLVVVSDDIDLPFGDCKVSVGRGPGGHNGVASIIDCLGSKDFTRVRVGVAKKQFLTGAIVRPTGAALTTHVLGAFTPREEKQLGPIIERAAAAAACVVTDGAAAAMNAYN